MPGAKPVKYEFVKNPEPVEMLVTQDDGKKWRMRILVKVLGVDDQCQMNPLNQQPMFAVKATLFVDTQPAEGQK